MADVSSVPYVATIDDATNETGLAASESLTKTYQNPCFYTPEAGESQFLQKGISLKKLSRKLELMVNSTKLELVNLVRLTIGHDELRKNDLPSEFGEILAIIFDHNHKSISSAFSIMKDVQKVQRLLKKFDSKLKDGIVTFNNKICFCTMKNTIYSGSCVYTQDVSTKVLHSLDDEFVCRSQTCFKRFKNGLGLLSSICSNHLTSAKLNSPIPEECMENPPLFLDKFQRFFVLEKLLKIKSCLAESSRVSTFSSNCALSFETETGLTYSLEGSGNENVILSQFTVASDEDHFWDTHYGFVTTTCLVFVGVLICMLIVYCLCKRFHCCCMCCSREIIPIRHDKDEADTKIALAHSRRRSQKDYY